MAKYAQANRFMAVTTPLGEDVLLLSGFRGHEGLSQLFSFHLDLLADREATVAFDRILGQRVTVHIAAANGSPRHFNGIVRSFRRLEADEDFGHFEAEIVPRLWLWTRKVRSRIFQHQSVPDILKAVFQGLEGTQYHLTGSYPARDFVVQYRESDFAFASRLMEEEGLSYFFKHEDGKHHLIVTDAPAVFAETPWPGTVNFDARDRLGEVRVRRWEKRQELCAGSVTLDDYTFELPGTDLRVTEGVGEGVDAGAVHHSFRLANQDIDVYDYPAGFAKRFDGVASGGASQADDLAKVFPEGQRLARLRMEQEAVGALHIEGTSNSVNFAAGACFTLGRHADADGEYLLTRIEHQAAIRGNFRSGEFEALDYHNEFRCLPKGLAYRPPRMTPRPHILGPQTATVTGPAGQDVFVDGYGRVKVHFHWDRSGPTDAGSSCWVRVGQIWAGNRFGAFFWPRIGQEVIVAFEDGDPDQPVIIGSVYNAAHMPPFELPANELVSGIRSCTAQGGDPLTHFSGLLFYDTPDGEYVQLHSERHELSNTETSKYAHVGHTNTKIVGGLSLGSSGSGGGSEGGNGQDTGNGNGTDGNGDNGTSEKKPAVPLFFEAEQLGEWGADLNLTFGVSCENLIGLKGDYIIGNYNEVIVNPLGFLAQFGGGGFLPGVAMGLGAISGGLKLIIGSESILVYGPGLEVHRGATYEYSGPPSAWWTLGAALTGSLVMATSVASGLVPGSSLQYIIGYAGTVIYELALAVLTSLEGINAKVHAAEEEVEAAGKTAEMVMELSTFALELTAEVERRSTQALRDAASAAAADTQGAYAAANSTNKVLQSPYLLSAYDITLRSAVPPPVGGAVLVGAPGSSITLDAQGSGIGDGLLLLNATGAAAMRVGLASVGVGQLAGLPLVLVEGGATGSVVIHQGIPDIGPKIGVTPQGIQLGIGVMGAGPFITMTPMGIKIQFAEWYINLGPMGITFSVGESTFTLTPAGIQMGGLNMEMQAEASMSHSATIVELDAQGEGSQNWALALLE